jgi:hypothetical protein
MSMVAAAFMLVLFGAVQATAAPPKVAISIRQHHAISPAAANLKVTVERDPDNRSVTIVVDGPEYYRASYIQLDGVSSPRIRQMTLKHLPPGSYVISATVTRADGSRVHATDKIEILGPEHDLGESLASRKAPPR